MFVVQDQPERRSASGLLGGGSNLHALFGMSCDFNRLELPFKACFECENRVHQYIAAKNWAYPPLQNKCPHCLSWNTDHLSSSTYTNNGYERPPDLTVNHPGFSFFEGPGILTSSILIAGWNHCIDMFAVQRQWLESDVKRYLAQLCINEATVTFFVDHCRRYVYRNHLSENEEQYTHEEVANTILDYAENPQKYALPTPPAMWQLGEVEDKTEGIMHLSMGIQKSVFKFIIRWAAGNKKGASLQRRLAESLGAVQDLKLSYCPCRPYKDEKFGGFTAEVYRAMTMISGCLYLCLLEQDLEPAPQRGPNGGPQNKWTRQDNENWMYIRDVEYSESITAPEAREQVRRLLSGDEEPLPVRELPVPITRDEIRDLFWRMHNMFRAIFSTDLVGSPAKNRATASVMRFLSKIETLDLQLNPTRKSPIWIAKFNYLGLLRVCGSFTRFNHVRNLYEGGIIGEGIVKVLRPLVAKGVHGRWATNLLLAHYRQTTLDMLIEAAEDRNQQIRKCPLGDDVESSKFKRFSTATEVAHAMDNGRPLPVLIYGSPEEWRVGVIIVDQKQWNFREIEFSFAGDFFDDEYGPTYHKVRLLEEETLLGIVNGEFVQHLGESQLPFWDYAVMMADTLHELAPYRYSVKRAGWQHLDANYQWNEHE